MSVSRFSRSSFSNRNMPRLKMRKGFVTASGSPATVGTKENRNPVLIIDFGKPLFGFAHLDFEAPEDAVIDIAYGNAVVNGRVEIDKASKFGDRCICRAGPSGLANIRRQTV